MRPKYRDMISEEERKEQYEKVMAFYKERKKGMPDPAKILNVECEWETEEEMERWIEENNRRVEEKFKGWKTILTER